jgi:hypothetical protein
MWPGFRTRARPMLRRTIESLPSGGQGPADRPKRRCPIAPIAEVAALAHKGAMFQLRSPWFALACGMLLLALGIVVRLFAGGLFAPILFTLAVPLLFEGVAWFGAAKVGRHFYDLDERVIHAEAHDPRALLLRYAIICGLLFAILIAREADALPAGFGEWLVLVLIGFLWIAFVLRSYGRQIAALARRKKVPLNPSEDRV